ncbi:UvrD-helicase domain-containing protein [Nocardia arthritidis]|uniref:AAA family ATPase n=1 Tax=Nocardia arthritidis TaxID=228602 RepID=A0A6G9YN96_9NOCA|nr:UvrD-helicase domain-containing protein [Nocardia arthritidis]QIS14547.1 AAA family ATPase [Nocardia arthritidis]
MPTNIAWEQRRQRVGEALRKISGLHGDRRNAFEALLTHDRTCHLLVAEPRTTTAGQADAFLLRRTGIYALTFAEALDDSFLHQLRAQTADACSAITMGRNAFVPSAVPIVQVLPAGRADAADERVVAATLTNLVNVVAAERVRYSAEKITQWALMLSQRLPGYIPITVPAENTQTHRDGTDDGLFTAAEANSRQRDHALTLRWEQWMHFLDNEQRGYVRKNYTGPARIAGPAGTGKSVVAMHRLARIARESRGRLLFTTFVGSLPKCQGAAFRNLAPEVADRVEFTTLHRWARRHLADTGAVDFGRYSLDRRDIDSAFGHAWRDSGRADGPLAQVIPDARYWHDEITQVIEGRGIRTASEYRSLRRTRDRLKLPPDLRDEVWNLYESYVGYKRENDVLDWSDVLLQALAELRRKPLEARYRMVIVDEVQDIPMIGVLLAAELTDIAEPNSLLLVGDGQQQVYPAGWRVSELGWEWRGRSEVLRVNYRNRRAVHEHARAIGAGNSLDDTGDVPAIPLHDTTAALDGGSVEHWRGTEFELADALADALRARPRPRPPTAVIVDNNQQVDRIIGKLRRAGFDAQHLDQYDCTPSERVVVGTVYLAKGLDFAEVFRIVEANTQGITSYESDRRDRQSLVAATRARDYLWIGVVGESGT